MKRVNLGMEFPDKHFLTIVILVFFMAGLSANARGQNLKQFNVAAEGSAVTTSSEVQEVTPAPAGDSSGPGHVSVNRRAYLRPHPERDTLTNHYFGLGPKLNKVGIESTLNFWALYQWGVEGGLKTDDGSSGFYHFANHFDLEKMFGLRGASLFARVDSSWDDSINEAVGSLMRVNALTYGDEDIGLTQLWFEQTFLKKRIRVRIGKEDVSQNGFDFHGQNASFDAMPYANFEGTQFLDSGLVNNASIPFPESGPGAVLLVEPIDRIYVAAGGISASADAFIFVGSDDFHEWMFPVEIGFVAQPGGLPGLYYAGYWYSQFEDDPSAEGMYLGMAQLLYREQDTKEQGLGVFARYGYASDLTIKLFWSIGAQYEGLLPGRDRDILALGWAQSFTRGGEFDEPYEGALEFYYRARVTPWLHLSPHIQYIANPGSSDVDDAVTLSLRSQITF